jgi:hypothetical protein
MCASCKIYSGFSVIHTMDTPMWKTHPQSTYENALHIGEKWFIETQ